MDVRDVAAGYLSAFQNPFVSGHDSSQIAGSSPHRWLSISSMQILFKSKIGKRPKPGDNNDYVVVTFNFAKSDEIINSR